MFRIYNKALTLIMGKVYHKQFFQKLAIFAVLFSFLTLSFSVYVLMSLANLNVENLITKLNEPSTTLKSSNQLEVHFLNIGQGDAIYVVAPNKNSMLIDSGPQNEKVISEIQKFKSMFDRRLDVLLATHADADHIGSMKKVIEKFMYQIFAYSGLSSDTKLFGDLMSVITENAGTNVSAINSQNKINSENAENLKSAKNIILTDGMSIVLDEKNKIRFDVLFPDFDYQINAYQECEKMEKNKIENKNSRKTKNSENDKNYKKSKTQKDTASRKIKKDICLKYLSTETNLNSVVGKLSYGSTSFMLTGDAPMSVENFIIGKYYHDANFLKSNVLKLGHHGSKTSTSPEFLSEVEPQFAVVSAGKDNRYGHPHKRVLDTITEFGNAKLKILRTDVDGTISFYSDGSTINIGL